MRSGLLSLTILSLGFCLLGPVATADAQASFGHDIALAESLYVSDQLDAPMQILSGSVSKATGEEAVQIYRLLILSFLQKGASADAAVTTVQLLHRVPDYWPNTTNDPPAYVQLVNQMRAVLFSANTQSVSCQQALDTASAQYVQGAYADAEFVLTDCLNRNLIYIPDTEYVPALKLLALLYIKAGNIPQAQSAIDRLLSMKADYAPDPVQDPPGYVALVEIRKKVSQQPAP